MGHDGLELPGEVAVTDDLKGAGQRAVEGNFVAGTGLEPAFEFEAEDTGFGLEVERAVGDGLGLSFAGDADGCGVEQAGVDVCRESCFDAF